MNGILSATGRSLIRCRAWNTAGQGESGPQPRRAAGQKPLGAGREELRGILLPLAVVSSRNPDISLDPVIGTNSAQGTQKSRGLCKLSKILFKMQVALEG